MRIHGQVPVERESKTVPPSSGVDLLMGFESVRWVGCVVVGLLGACASSTEPSTGPGTHAAHGGAAQPTSSSVAIAAQPSTRAQSEEASIDPRFEQDLLRIAGDYEWLPRADGTSWAPLLCMAPTHPAFASRANHGEHAKKLYTLFVKDMGTYAALSERSLPNQPKETANRLPGMSQVIVKEAWKPVLADEYTTACPSQVNGRPAMRSYLDNVTIDGKVYAACDMAGLFIMYRPEDPARGVDDGWVYGTVQFDQQEGTQPGQAHFVPRVTSSGKVASCMGCHTRAPHGRLFGLPAN